MSDESDYSEEEVSGSTEKKAWKNNVHGMLQVLNQLQNQLKWVERLDITAEAEEIEKSEDLSQNDFAREKMFYDLAQKCAKEGLSRLEAMDYPTKRPDDYFAQMAKSDGHMRKVRSKLLSKQASAERSAQAKKLREMRKFGKKVQQDVMRKRQKEKRDTLEAIKKYRKGQQDKLDFLQAEREGQGKKVKMTKRQYKDKKFGFGGQKKRSKRPTAYSSANVEGIPKKQHMAARGNRNKNRPGKSRRKQGKK